MKTYRKTARMAGLFFLIAMVASLMGGVAFVEPSLGAPDFLMAVVENRSQVIIGVMMELVNSLCVVGIGVLMFPVLKKHNDNAAVGYLALRIIESVFCALIVISPLSLITLGQQYLVDGASQAAAFQAAGALSIAERAGISGLLIPVFLALGGLVLYTALYRSRFLPRFIAVWGLIGASLILAMNLMMTFGVSLGALAMAFALPIITNEIFLGIWLIVKGFDQSALDAKAA